ncbi:hypothetical protein FO519_000717 [Halicephalobus sp. NKZ332]|nr:hypothetical protein FO519_000717 [Halicephalobus sp. NKZ332]
MSSGGLAPQQPPVTNLVPFFTDSSNTPTTNFGNIFSNNTNFSLQHILAAAVSSQRAKLKRCRQRVDAGEPRNSYQNQMKMNGFKRERSVSAPSENGFNVKIGECENNSEDVPSKRSKQDVIDDENTFADEIDQKEIDEMLEQDEQQNEAPEADNVCHSNNSAMSNSSSRRKCFHPQRQVTGNNDLAEDSEFANEAVEVEENSIVGENGSPSPGAEDENEDSSHNPAQSGNPNYFLNMMSMLPPPLNNFNSGGTSKLHELLEAQRRVQMSNHESNTKDSNSSEKISSLSQFHQIQHQEVNQSILRLMQNLKEEIGTAIDKVVSEYRTREVRAFMERMLKTVAFTTEMQQQMQDMKQQQQRIAAAAAASFLMPKSVNSMYNNSTPSGVPSFTNPAVSNFLAAAAAANQNTNTSCNNSIFPTPQSLANLSAMGNSLSQNSLLMSGNNTNDCSLRKKRSKVTDSLRVNKTGIVRDTSSSLPASERSSPLANNYFPPTMVSHPLYNGTNFTADDLGESADNSDSFSDCGPYDGNYTQSSTLTPIHLRKAKLMFFYTRYPSSSLLKSYFPDIRFNKNNTAQLVKWFSNFREFFYMQMEKYAKQALAEGTEHRSQIIVAEDSEIYKTLNQHYNRNNLFPPPPRLRNVIEETLREFFTALQQGRDSEPSWKKAIYKIINQMDDPIPEHFKHPSFMNSLE